MAVTARRAHQERRQQQAGVEFEDSPRFGKQQAEPRRTQPR
jgi:hypothetical protein